MLFLCILKFDENSSRRSSIMYSLHPFLFKMPYMIIFKCFSFYVCLYALSQVWFFVTLWTVALPGPLSMGFSSQEYRSKLPSLVPGDLLNQELQPSLLHLLHWQVDSLPLCCLETFTCVYIYLYIHAHINTHIMSW